MATTLSALELTAPSQRHAVPRLRFVLESALVFILAVMLASFWLGSRAHFDELYHLLAGQGILATGEPVIAGGAYVRGHLFTQIVAYSLDLFGPTLLAARLPTLFFFAASATLLFVWVRVEVGRPAALITTALVLLSPLALDIGYMARFYALHTLLFLIASWCIWRLGSAQDRPAVQVGLVMLAGPTIAVALDLHMLTAIHLAGAMLWLAGAIALRLIAAGRGRLVLVLLLGALALGGALLALESDRLADLLRGYRWVPTWAAETRNEVEFYHLRLIETYPLFWALTPFAVYFALTARPAFTSFALLVFVVAFVLLSFGGMKSDRYLFGPKLFLLAIWAIGLASAWPVLGRAMIRLTGRVLQVLPWAVPERTGRRVLVAAALVFLFAASGEPFKAVYAFAKGELPHAPGRNVIAPEWPAAAGPLAPWLDRSEIVMTSDELSALHFLGRANLIVSQTRLSEVGDHTDFERDPRTGLHLIASADGVARVVACHTSGLAVIPAFDFDAGWTVPAATARRIEELMQPIELEGLPGLRVFRFENPAPESCPTIPSLTAGLHPILGAR